MTGTILFFKPNRLQAYHCPLITLSVCTRFAREYFDLVVKIKSCVQNLDRIGVATHQPRNHKNCSISVSLHLSSCQGTKIDSENLKKESFGKKSRTNCLNADEHKTYCLLKNSLLYSWMNSLQRYRFPQGQLRVHRDLTKNNPVLKVLTERLSGRTI